MTVTTHFGARVRLRVVSQSLAVAAACPVFFFIAPLGSIEAHAKTPGSRYCFTHACHRVLTIAETRALVGKPTNAVTSFYDDCRRDSYNPCGLTSSGEAFRPNETNSAASPIYPDGTVILVRNPRNGESAIVRINNAGPYWGNRTLDLSRAAGLKLGLGHSGVARVEVTVLRAPTAREALYQRGRVYPRLPGHVGRFASLDEAQIFASVSLKLPDAIGSSAIKVARAEPHVTRVTPVGFQPITGAPPTGRRLPADVVRLSAVDTQKQESVTSPGTAKVADLRQHKVERAVEIRGESLLVPQARNSPRALNPRAAQVIALRAGDFDVRGRSLLLPVAGAAADQSGKSPTEVAFLGADARASGRIQPLAIERMPPLATGGERGWSRRAKAEVSHVVEFAPATVTASPTRLAHWAAQVATSSRARSARHATSRPASSLRPFAELSASHRMAILGRSPARARQTEFVFMAA